MLIAQHMPDNFTRTFAERLDRHSALEVTEARARPGDRWAPAALVCPGRRCLEVQSDGRQFATRRALPDDRGPLRAERRPAVFAAWPPSRGKSTIGVILTGMGDDGVEGARAIVDAGGIVIAESAETAVVYGMPQAAVKAGRGATQPADR